MIIQFQHPSNGFKTFDPSNDAHYANLNASGVYIYGIRIEFKFNNTLNRKFLPLCVGETSNLKKRLFNDHYQQLKTGGNSKKEVFNWGRITNYKDIVDNYIDMKNYQQSKAFHNSNLENLIWYNNPNFFNNKLGIKTPNGSIYKSNTGIMKSISNNTDLDIIFINNNRLLSALKLKYDIKLTKEIFNKDFYFVYARLDDQSHMTQDFEFELQKLYSNFRNPNNYNSSDGQRFAKRIELATKKALNKIGIHTTAKADGEMHSMDIDLTKVSNDLINLGNHPYDYSNLIIPMKKL